MSATKRAGHASGRGHGPGGRLWPMRGDMVELRRPFCTENQPGKETQIWDLAEVTHTTGDHWALLKVVNASLPHGGYTVPRFLARHQDKWRWPDPATAKPTPGLRDP